MSQKPYNELVKELDALIPRDCIETRDGGGGKKLDYLPGWYVIDRLNQVVGPGNWAYSSQVTLLHSGTVQDRYGKDVNTVHYSAQVRLVVTLGDKPTEFTDYGYGDGTDKNNPGKAHELAIKEAVTDGLKRAARCLGNSFGNGLYDKSGDGIEENEEKNTGAPQVSQETKQTAQTSREVVNKLISQTSKVAIDKKRLTFDQAVGMIKEYGVNAKEDLTNEQAQDLLTKLRKVIE